MTIHMSHSQEHQSILDRLAALERAVGIQYWRDGFQVYGPIAPAPTQSPQPPQPPQLPIVYNNQTPIQGALATQHATDQSYSEHL